MPRTYKRQLGHRINRNYSKEALERAVRSIIQDGLSLREAQNRYKVPKSTLSDLLKTLGRAEVENRLDNCEIVIPIRVNKIGRPTALSKEDEETIVHCLTMASDYGFPFDSIALRTVVKQFLDRAGRVVPEFRDNEPGDDWARSFLKRHPSIKQRMSENLNRSRAAVGREAVKRFIHNLQNEIETHNVEPDLIVNYDETNIVDDPGRKKVIVRRTSRHAHRLMDASKSSHSVMFCGSASGNLLPIYMVFRSGHLYDTWTIGGPAGARYNRSKSGWFDGQIYENWFETVLVPYFKKKDPSNEKFKIVLGDNLASHLNVHVLEICEENKIKFVFLPPNSTGLLQPLDVSYFRPFKIKWRQNLEQWKLKNRGIIPKQEIPKLLKKCLNEIDSKKNLIAGFEATGIYPCNEDRPLSRLPGSPPRTPTAGGHVDTNSSGSSRGSSSSGEKPLWAETFANLLQRQRFGSPTATSKGRKKRLLVSPGKSISRRDLGFGDPGDNSDSDFDGNIDDVEPIDEPENEDSSENFLDEPSGSGLNASTCVIERMNEQEMTIVAGNFVMVELVYEQKKKKYGKKSFVACVLDVSESNVDCNFLRPDSNTATFYYPHIKDNMSVKKKDIVRTLTLVDVKRGHYNFDTDVYHVCK